MDRYSTAQGEALQLRIYAYLTRDDAVVYSFEADAIKEFGSGVRFQDRHTARATLEAALDELDQRARDHGIAQNPDGTPWVGAGHRLQDVDKTDEPDAATISEADGGS